MNNVVSEYIKFLKKYEVSSIERKKMFKGAKMNKSYIYLYLYMCDLFSSDIHSENIIIDYNEDCVSLSINATKDFNVSYNEHFYGEQTVLKNDIVTILIKYKDGSIIRDLYIGDKCIGNVYKISIQGISIYDITSNIDYELFNIKNIIRHIVMELDYINGKILFFKNKHKKYDAIYFYRNSISINNYKYEELSDLIVMFYKKILKK